MICGTFFSSAIFAMSLILSGSLGEKNAVVDRIAAVFSLTAFSISPVETFTASQ